MNSMVEAQIAALLALPVLERRAAIMALEPAEQAALAYTWALFARTDRMPPAGVWRIWALVAGRGAGKTRSAAESVRHGVETGRRRSIGIVGPTADTLRRDVVQGVSGLLATAPHWNKPEHQPSQRRIVWPNGAVAHLLSSEEADRIRGVNLDGFWGDELTSWSNPEDCWSNLQFALRITGPKGDAPAGVISTTPKNHKLLKTILADPSTVITRASTFDNAANLDPSTLAYLRRTYEGSQLGRQELMAALLEDMEGALWSRALLDASRVHFAPPMRRVVIAVDPAGGSSKASDETGILGCGRGDDGHGYVLRDHSGRYSPEGWASRAVALYHELDADRIVAEQDFGGGMVAAMIRAVDRTVPVKMVQASRGKAVRAEPISALFEQHRAHIVGSLPVLEDQLCSWNPLEPGHSPDRLDAMVWGLTDLIGQAEARPARYARVDLMGQ